MGCISSSQSSLTHSQSFTLPREPLDISKVIQLWGDLNTAITDFCEECAPPLPNDASISPDVLATSTHFKLLAIINERLNQHIFRPFHPSLPTSQSDRYNRDFALKFETREVFVHLRHNISRLTAGQYNIRLSRRSIKAPDYRIQQNQDRVRRIRPAYQAKH